MPEGDTIARAARKLAAALEGRTVARVASQLVAIERAGLAGARVAKVDAVGKNLLVHFDDGRVLHTHLGMHGSWRVHRDSERWKRPPSHVRVLLAADGVVAVCFDAPVVRLVSESRARRDMAPLGPDVLAEGFDAAEAARRLRAEERREIGDALLQQRAVAGIGNVYKSEVLYLTRTDPRAKVASLDDATLARILGEARKWMRYNVTARGPRRTRGGGTPLWVYGRAGQPCLRCGARVQRITQGLARRSTYFCPACQPPSRLSSTAP